MKLKLICCEVFMRMAFYRAAISPNMIDIDFIPVRAHEDADELRKTITEKIAATEAGPVDYDAIILGYGLCGNSLSGIAAIGTQLVIPRAHDCCAIFLGSRLKFKEHFGDKLSATWSSHGYMERCGDYLRETDTGKMLGLDKGYAELVEKYGEENAAYIWETVHPAFHDNEVIFIRIPEIDKLGFSERFMESAEADGKELTWLEGDMSLIRKLLDGDWNADEFLIVKPGQKITPTYDLISVFEAE